MIDRAQLLACCFPFVTERPVAVTTEGLLRYLTIEGKTHLSANVHEILRRDGGWWITPDIHLRSWAQRRSPMYRQIEQETLGHNLESNYFADLDEAQRFFESCDFAVDSRPLLEGNFSPIAPERNEDQIAELNDRRLFVLTTKR